MKSLENLQILTLDNIKVEILKDSPCKLQQLTGKTGMDNLIGSKSIYRPQLALSGFLELFNFRAVQIFGNTEFYYLSRLDKKERIDSFRKIAELDIPCIILTNGHILEKNLIDVAMENNIAVFKTEYETTKATALLSDFLDDQFSPQAVVHGSFVDVYGVGILFVGKSGIGKSEITLDLVERGHRLVADDVVMLTKKHETVLMGTGTSMIQHFMEIRGLGIIDIRQMFGIRAIRFQKRLEIVVELEEWTKSSDYTRIGLDEEPIDVMEVEIQSVKLPIFPGKNITVIAEVIALNYLLRTYGYDAAKVLTDKLHDSISRNKGPSSNFRSQRSISWFQSDRE